MFGVYSSLMCDFGDNFEVTDHDGIEPSEFLIGHITKVILRALHLISLLQWKLCAFPG